LHNGAATHVMDWRASGNLARRATTFGGKTTTRTDFEDAGQKPIHATWEGDGSGTKLEVGTTASRWTYTGNGLLKTVPGHVTDALYEADGQTRSIAYANGVTTSFIYSPQRRWLAGFETRQANGTVLLKGSYTRDNAGRILSIDGPGLADDWTYTYDHLDQRNCPPPFWVLGRGQRATVLRMVWNGRTPVRRRAVSTTVRTSASPFAAHIAR
jgi:hypothetical protein